MTRTPRLLDHSLLEAFASRLHDQGAPAIAAARPGLNEKDIQDLASPLGLSLPAEARAWWGWRDGVARESGAAARAIGPGRQWLPLEEAASECTRIRQMIAEVWRDDPREAAVRWSASWLPLVHSEGLVVIDTAADERSPCPVRIHWFDERPGPPHLRSIGELVAIWIDAIDRGAWRYDRRADRWIVDKDRLEPGIGMPGIA